MRPVSQGKTLGCFAYLVPLLVVGALTWWGFDTHQEFTWSVIKFLGYSLAALIVFVLCYRLLSSAVHAIIREWRAKHTTQAEDIADRARSYFEGLGNV